MLSAPEYLPYLIKDYKYWQLFLHKKQKPYVGRCYAWWKDTTLNEGDGMSPDRVPSEALLELNHTIYSDVVDACHALGYQTEPYSKCFLLNKCYLANEPQHNHHLHEHFIPRSKHPLIIEKIDLRVQDFEWEHNYAKPATGEWELEEERLQFIRSVMAQAVHGNTHP